MTLYTFITDYAGGTYISQVVASDPKSAIIAWAQNLEVESIPGLGVKSKQSLLQEIQQEETIVVSLDDVVNVWCFVLRARGKLMLVNFVETNPSPSGVSQAS